MRSIGEISVALSVTTILAMAAVGCGGGSGGSSSTGATTSTSGSTSTAAKTSSSPASQSEPSAEFVGKGKNGTLAKVGTEASAAEREAASTVLRESFAARETGDWKAQCETLATSLIEGIEKSAAVLGAAGGCPKTLEAQAKPVPPSSLASTLTGPIAALRINEGINGFAFWHGPAGKDYVIPLIKQGGEWKLVSLQEQSAP
jgi:hypothetical protein